MQKYLIALSVLFLMSCAGGYKVQITPGYEPPEGKEIAVFYLDHPDVTIANSATAVLEKTLDYCSKINYINAAITDSIFQANDIHLPRRLSKNYLTSLREFLPTKYLLTGGVIKWIKGSIGFPVASSTEVAISLTLYDIENGEVVWTVSGDEIGMAGIFAESPEDKAEWVFSRMLHKWDGFCKSIYD